MRDGVAAGSAEAGRGSLAWNRCGASRWWDALNPYKRRDHERAAAGIIRRGELSGSYVEMPARLVAFGFARVGQMRP